MLKPFTAIVLNGRIKVGRSIVSILTSENDLMARSPALMYSSVTFMLFNENGCGLKSKARKRWTYSATSFLFNL